MSGAPAAPESASAASAERSRPERYREHRLNSPFVPLAILAAAMLLWVGFQTVMLARESNVLAATRDNQEVQAKGAQKLRDALDALARDTAKLADQGNPSARIIVEELRKRGVTINPDAPRPPSK